MTQTEALKLAQKALSNRNATAKMIYEALHAIKEALAQRKEPEPDYKVLWEQMCERCDELDNKLAHPEQELVCICGAVWEGQELVSTPPQRTWVGLTEEEVEVCFHHVDEAGIGLFDFAEAIEAKLKEKNS